MPLGTALRRLRAILKVRSVAAQNLAQRLATDPRELRKFPEVARQLADSVRSEGLRGAWTYINESTHALSRDQFYGRWVEEEDTLTEADVSAIRAQIEGLDYQPLLSIVMPVFETDERWLRLALDSVLAQLYPHWQLCAVDDHSSQERVARVLREYAERDPRIVVRIRESRGHICAASNDALELCSGEFIALMDHDDELPVHALYMVAEGLNRHPDADILFSDEDKIDARGERFDPYFKPDFNPELLWSQNMISHLGVYRAALVREVGGFREGFEGSQDHDLALRVLERTSSARVLHIPAILYRWRAIRGSTAIHPGEKNYAVEAGRRAVAEHLERCEPRASVLPSPISTWNRLRFEIPEPRPLVSIIVPTRDRVRLLKACVASVLSRTAYERYEILVVDNGSVEARTRRYLERITSHDHVRVLAYDHPFNFPAINNFAAEQANGEVLCLLNNDVTVINEDWLTELVSHAVRPGIGAVGAMLYYPNDRIQHAGVSVGLGGVAGHRYSGAFRGTIGHIGGACLTQELSAVTAACLAVVKSRYDEVGGLDEELTVAFNDVDFCLRLRAAGYRNIWTPFAELYHHESASRGYDGHEDRLPRFQQEVEIMKARYGRALAEDPFFNPNLPVIYHRDVPMAGPARQTRPWKG